MEGNFNHQSRRKFLYNLALAGISIPLISANSKCNSETAQKTTAQNKKDGKLGIALVGLGTYSNILASALSETERCYLAGIVTGTPSKIPTWKERYNIPDKNIYSYESFDSIKDNPDIDIVYVVLPNSMHAEYVIRAAQAGKHVICEKPMALTVEECDKMIAACKKAGKTLSIGYRLHFEPYNLEMQRLGGQKVYGAIKNIKAGFAFNIGDPTQWRLKKALAGGGPLQDLGIYCIQGLCYTTGMNPVAITAKEGPKTDLEKFKEVEQSLTWQMEMPGGLICEGKTSYADGMNYLEADAEKGKFGLRPAFGYSGQKGFTPEGEMIFPRVNQQAKQLDGISSAIKNKQLTIVPGEMGRRDVKIIQAIYEAMRTGKRVEIK
jgi:predicted dehydrogenase